MLGPLTVTARETTHARLSRLLYARIYTHTHTARTYTPPLPPPSASLKRNSSRALLPQPPALDPSNAYCLLLTVYCLLLTAYCLLLIAYCLLLTTDY